MIIERVQSFSFNLATPSPPWSSDNQKSIIYSLAYKGVFIQKPSKYTCNHVLNEFLFLYSAGLDYIAVNKILDFAPGVTLNTVTIQILDDLGRPQLEGVEHFQIVLKSTIGGSLGSPDKATIYINDSQSDGS